MTRNKSQLVLVNLALYVTLASPVSKTRQNSSQSIDLQP